MEVSHCCLYIDVPPPVLKLFKINFGKRERPSYSLRQRYTTLQTSCKQIKLRKCGLDEWSVRWTENWLNGTAQRVVISGAESSWRPLTSGVPPRVSTQPTLVQFIHQ